MTPSLSPSRHTQAHNQGGRREERARSCRCRGGVPQRPDLSCLVTLVISGTRACKPVHFIHGCRGWVSRREIRIRTMLAGCIGPLGRSSGNIAAHWVKPSKWPLGGWRLAQCNSVRCALEWLYGQAWIARSISYSHYLSEPSHTSAGA